MQPARQRNELTGSPPWRPVLVDWVLGFLGCASSEVMDAPNAPFNDQH